MLFWSDRLNLDLSDERQLDFSPSLPSDDDLSPAEMSFEDPNLSGWEVLERNKSNQLRSAWLAIIGLPAVVESCATQMPDGAAVS